MAYMNLERKNALAPKIKEVLKKYGLRGSISMRHHLTLVLTITSGKIDFIGNHNDVVEDYNIGAEEYRKWQIAKDNMQVNTYHIGSSFTDMAKDALEELKEAMSVGNWDRSDIQSDYFDVGWYVDINIGKYNKPYAVKGN